MQQLLWQRCRKYLQEQLHLQNFLSKCLGEKRLKTIFKTISRKKKPLKFEKLKKEWSTPHKISEAYLSHECDLGSTTPQSAGKEIGIKTRGNRGDAGLKGAMVCVAVTCTCLYSRPSLLKPFFFLFLSKRASTTFLQL